jgi:hypothetical protein
MYIICRPLKHKYVQFCSRLYPLPSKSCQSHTINTIYSRQNIPLKQSSSRHAEHCAMQHRPTKTFHGNKRSSLPIPVEIAAPLVLEYPLQCPYCSSHQPFVSSHCGGFSCAPHLFPPFLPLPPSSFHPPILAPLPSIAAPPVAVLPSPAPPPKLKFPTLSTTPPSIAVPL